MALLIPPFDAESPTFDDVRRILRANDIKIENDEEEFGYISFRYNNCLGFFEGKDFHQVYFPFFCFEDWELQDRSPFDAEFLAARSQLAAQYGSPCDEGRHVYSHRRPEHYYLYAVWGLRHCRLALAQDEFDIQFGLDLSLRFLYKAGPAKMRIYELGGPPTE
jgi:hypothetical protein